VYCVPIAISFVNYVSKMILRTMTSFEKRQSLPLVKYSSAINMTIISFINIGILVLLVNLKIE